MKLYFSSTDYNELISTRDQVFIDIAENTEDIETINYYLNNHLFNNLTSHLTEFYITSKELCKHSIFDENWRLMCIDLKNKTSKMFALNDPLIQKSYLEAKKLAMLL